MSDTPLDSKKYRIGLLHHGNKTNIWGSVITTKYLEKALLKLGHDVYNISVTQHEDYPTILSKKTDFFISEGVPEWQIPKGVWDTTDKKIFWWLSELWYDVDNIDTSNFDAIATNSNLEPKKPHAKIDLAVDAGIHYAGVNEAYMGYYAYIGLYPHKSIEQMDGLFLPCIKYGKLGLWGKGWVKSPYKEYDKGVLELNEIGTLYKSVKAALLLTEMKQKAKNMINNRVYEVLGSGCLAISEPFEYLENSDLGKYIQFVKKDEDMKTILERHEAGEFKQTIVAAQRYVLENHNYIKRAEQFIKLFESL